MRGRPRAPFHWRWLVDSPLLLASWASFVLVVLALRPVAAALRAAEAVQAETDQAQARLCAEQVAADLLRAGEVDLGRSDAVVVRLGSLVCTATPAGDGGLRVAVQGRAGRAHEFWCEALPGGAPAALREPLTVFGAAPLPPDLAAAPRPPAAARPRLLVPERHVEALSTLGFARDPAVGLLHLAAGTDAEDLTWGAGRAELALEPATGVVVVPGNLWLCGTGPLTLRLARDLTVVVRGNLYLGRSVTVVGPGRLLLATDAAAGRPFADRDGNGRWSAGDGLLGPEPFRGPIEGAGGVWLGLPGEPGPVLEVGAGLLVDGELHLNADTTVHGPVVLGHGVTRLADGVALRPTGRRLPDVERGRVPGLRPEGAPRPGRLLAAPPR